MKLRKWVFKQILFEWKITKFAKVEIPIRKNWKSFFIIKIKVRLILSNWNVQTAKGVVKDRKLLTPKKGLSKANKVLFIFKVYEPFSLQKWHALQSEKYSVTQALKWCQGFSDFQNWQKIGGFKSSWFAW